MSHPHQIYRMGRGQGTRKTEAESRKSPVASRSEGHNS